MIVKLFDQKYFDKLINLFQVDDASAEHVLNIVKIILKFLGKVNKSLN
jgi:hypothetical protein